MGVAKLLLHCRIVVGGIQMAEILMKKLPDVFHVYFRREGKEIKLRSVLNNMGVDISIVFSSTNSGFKFHHTK